MGDGGKWGHLHAYIGRRSVVFVALLFSSHPIAAMYKACMPRCSRLINLHMQKRGNGNTEGTYRHRLHDRQMQSHAEFAQLKNLIGCREYMRVVYLVSIGRIYYSLMSHVSSSVAWCVFNHFINLHLRQHSLQKGPVKSVASGQCFGDSGHDPVLALIGIGPIKPWVPMPSGSLS